MQLRKVSASNRRYVSNSGVNSRIVVYQSNPDKSKVALICGGGSGHEPAHAGYVGEFRGDHRFSLAELARL